MSFPRLMHVITITQLLVCYIKELGHLRGQVSCQLAWELGDFYKRCLVLFAAGLDFWTLVILVSSLIVTVGMYTLMID